jgi:hypothetical protein
MAQRSIESGARWVTNREFYAICNNESCVLRHMYVGNESCVLRHMYVGNKSGVLRHMYVGNES